MRTESSLAKLSVLTVLVTVLISASTLIAADFSADMIQKEGDNIIKGKLLLSGKHYRMDINEEGQDISIVVDLNMGTTNVLVHSQKMFMTIENSSIQSLSNNPFETYRQSAERYETKQAGTENINGYECKKMEMSDQGKKLMTAWVSDKFEMPLKLIQAVKPYREIELKNIKEGPLDKSLFQVPSGYQGMNVPRFSPPNAPTIESLKQGKENIDQKKDTEQDSESTGYEQAILEILAEKGVKKTTKDGTVQLKEKESPILEKYFPDWKFYGITREIKIDGGTVYKHMQYKNAAYGKGKDVLILSSLGTDMALENELMIVQDTKINLKNRGDVEGLANALEALYFNDSKVENIELLEKNKWAIYTGTFFDSLKGFIVKVDDSGKVVELNYSLKIKGKAQK